MHIQLQPIFPILLTAVRLLRAAEVESGDVKNAIARSSIIHYPLLVESLANSLLVETGMNSSVQDDLERLTTVAKMDLCANLAGRGKFSRGEHYAQVFADLTKLRNDYVHPKRTKNTDVEKDGDSYFIGVSQKWPALDIARDPEVWGIPDAITVLKKTLASLDSYLLNVLHICNRRVERIFLHHIVQDDGETSLVTVPEKPWNLQLPDGVPFPRFLSRLESHDSYCTKVSDHPCAAHAQQVDPVDPTVPNH